jgi:hypothetical protein
MNLWSYPLNHIMWSTLTGLEKKTIILLSFDNRLPARTHDNEVFYTLFLKGFLAISDIP